MRTHRRTTMVAGVLMTALLLSGFTCTGSTKKLAIASDAISHALLNAQIAVKQATQTGVITTADEQEFETYLTRAAKAGMVLNQSIRQGESAQTVSQKTNAFLDAFNLLNTSGVIGIKNPALQLTISTILTGAETSVAIIAATVGGK